MATTVAGVEHFDEEALAVATAAAGFTRFGIEPRHLRLYKNAAEREAGFVEQVVLPLVRQRNPEARARAHETADELTQLGQQLRGSLLRTRPRKPPERLSRRSAGGGPPGRTCRRSHFRSAASKFGAMVEVRLRAVRVDLQSNTPVLLLQESEGLGRTLPIFIGAPEATAIAFALQGMDTPRPMTHDLIRDLLDALGADVVRVVITELKTATYFAEIVLRHGEQELPVSSRPSDAVAVAVRTGAPLFVADDLMDSEGIMLAVDEEEDDDDDEEDDEGSNPDELVGEFRTFLDSIRPEDFSS